MPAELPVKDGTVQLVDELMQRQHEMILLGWSLDLRETPKDEVEKIRACILREAEENFAKQIKKLTRGDGGETSSCHTAGSAGGRQQGFQGGQSSVPAGRAPEPPPGLPCSKLLGQLVADSSSPFDVLCICPGSWLVGRIVVVGSKDV